VLGRLGAAWVICDAATKTSAAAQIKREVGRMVVLQERGW
jgi:hypothetical protein